jgi:hypothetical protein
LRRHEGAALIHITAIRTQTTSPRVEQLAGVMIRFNIAAPSLFDGKRPRKFFQQVREDHSNFVWRTEDDGRVTLEIDLADEAQADDLIRELRMCGFVSTRGPP